MFRFNEAISFQVNCHSQFEIDHFWYALSAGGDEQAQQCGWLKDKFGLSWKIVPVALMEMMTDQDSSKSQRAMQAMLNMKKIDIATLERAFNDQG
ncbi:3-demethylubiquinone-9 3-methyltransferase [compost metagenome]